MSQPHPHHQTEQHRLDLDTARKANWKRWGPYLSERQWGTVREDYSADGNCWEYLPHDQARSRAYRWGEDGLLGICDRECRLVFCGGAVERKRSDPQGAAVRPDRPGGKSRRRREGAVLLPRQLAHAFVLQGALQISAGGISRTRSWWKKTAAAGAACRSSKSLDTGVFDDGKYFDVFVEYAKNSPDDVLIKITIANRSSRQRPRFMSCRRCGSATAGAGAATHEGCEPKPWMQKSGPTSVTIDHATLKQFRFEVEPLHGKSAGVAVHRERNELAATLGHGAEWSAVREGCVSRLRDHSRTPRP